MPTGPKLSPEWRWWSRPTSHLRGPGLGRQTIVSGQTKPAGAAASLHFSAARDGELFKRPGGERKQFIVSGIENHICVLQTVLDLLARGNQVFVVEEAVGSRRASDKALGLARPGNQEAALRYNSCARTIERETLEPPPDEPVHGIE